MSLEDRLLELSDRLNRLESQLADVPLYQLPPFDYDTRVPAAENVELVSSESTSGATRVAIRWLKPADPNIDHFEIWAKRTAFESESPYLVASVVDSPAAFTVTSDRDTAAVMTIRTVMKNGLGTDLNASPTVTARVYQYVNPLGPGTVKNSYLDRATADRVQIGPGDITSVNAYQISGPIQAYQIQNVNAYSIQGLLSAQQIGGVYAQNILGVLAYNQIGSVNAASITINQLAYNQIGSVAAQTITIGQLIDSQIQSLSFGKLTAGSARIGSGGLMLYSQGGLSLSDGGGITTYGGPIVLYNAGITASTVNSRLAYSVDGTLIVDVNRNLWNINTINTSGEITTQSGFTVGGSMGLGRGGVPYLLTVNTPAGTKTLWFLSGMLVSVM